MDPQSTALQQRVRLDCIQMLRAVAAIAVVTHHLHLFANGAWGVDLFFVISGFIMCYVTANSGSHFFAKRIIRIVPLYWAGTIAVFCIATIKPSLLGNTTANFVDLTKSLLFIPFKKGGNVFPVLFLGWTLNYEMFFYLLFALSMWVSHKNRVVVACALLLAVVLAGQLIAFQPVPLKFFSRPMVLEFAFGMLCYAFLMRTGLDHSHGRPLLPRILWTAAGIAFIACMPLASVLAPFEDPVIRWGILAALSFYCIVRGMSGVRLPRPLVIVGDASYSLYLFHPYVIQLFVKLSPTYAGSDARAYLMAFAAIALCCVLAVLSYKYLESPLTEFLRKRFVERISRPTVLQT